MTSSSSRVISKILTVAAVAGPLVPRSLTNSIAIIRARPRTSPIISYLARGDSGASWKRAPPHFDVNPGHPPGYENTKRWILEATQEKPVFFNDMRYYVYDYFTRDWNFTLTVTSTFLLRDPARRIPSYYTFDPEVTSEEIGLERLYKRFSMIAEATGRPPVAGDAGDLRKNPENTRRAYCNALGLAYIPEAPEWGGGPPAEWWNFAGWHQDVLDSKGVKTDRAPAEVDIDRPPHLLRGLV